MTVFGSTSSADATWGPAEANWQFYICYTFEYLSLSLEPLLCSSLSGAAADKSPPGILIGQIATDCGCQGVLKTMLPQAGGSFLLWLHHHCCAAPFGAHPDFSKEPTGLCVGQLPRVGLLLLLDKWLKPRFSFLVWVAANTAATVAGNCPQRTACVQTDLSGRLHEKTKS